MDRSQKADLVDELKNVFNETSVVVITRNNGLSVAQSTDLRRRSQRCQPVPAGAGLDRLRARGHDLDLVCPPEPAALAGDDSVSRGEDLGGPDHVERLHPRESEDDYPARVFRG